MPAWYVCQPGMAGGGISPRMLSSLKMNPATRRVNRGFFDGLGMYDTLGLSRRCSIGCNQTKSMRKLDTLH